MTRTLLSATAIILLGAALTACGSDGTSASNNTTVVLPGPAKVETQFGPNFALAFQADPNSTPRAVASGDIAPISLTAEPLAVK
jgi:hypothetical protein